jgi:hypothetical protein
MTGGPPGFCCRRRTQSPLEFRDLSEVQSKQLGHTATGSMTDGKRPTPAGQDRVLARARSFHLRWCERWFDGLDRKG